MIEPTLSETMRAKSWRSRLLDAWQLIFVLISAFIFFISFIDAPRKLEAPGAPVGLFWITVALSVLMLIVHWPSIFGRLPSRWRGGPYIAWVGLFFLMNTALTKVDAAWERTPQGVAEAKLAATADAEWTRTQRIEAEAEAQSQRDGTALREAEKLSKQVQEQADKLEACFTTFGHRLPALETPVKDSLHNPHVFEHVETVAIVTDGDRNNVAMTFRAENNYGALRTYVIKASVLPESCEVAATGEPELM